MSAIDAITILGGGVARGYRRRQQIERELQQIRREALLKQRELAIRENEAHSRDLLNDAQIKSSLSEADLNTFKLGQLKDQDKRNKQPLSPNPLRLHIQGNKFDLPATYGDVFGDNSSGVLREMIQGEYANERENASNNFRLNHPEIYNRGGGAGKLSPRAQIALAMAKELSGEPTDVEMAMDPEAALARRQKQAFDLLRHFQFPERDSLFVPDTSGTGRRNRFAGR